MLTIGNNHCYAVISLTIATILLVYYGAWVLALPFIDTEYLPGVSWMFPAIHLAILIPLGIGCVVSVLLFLRAFYLVNKDRRQAAQERLKSS